MTDRPHAKLAADTWRLIRALGEIDSRDEEFHDAARNIIEMACDSATEAQRPAVAACTLWNAIAAFAAGSGKQANARTALRRARKIAKQLTPTPHIVCPRCGAVSHHPKDISERYCGRCHRFHDETQP
jgi:ribosomal protein S27AE